jgi:hypothetical protein
LAAGLEEIRKGIREVLEGKIPKALEFIAKGLEKLKEGAKDIEAGVKCLCCEK